MQVPVPLSEARAGLWATVSPCPITPARGTVPTEFGWGATLPSITRKTSTGLPRYDDATTPTCSSSREPRISFPSWKMTTVTGTTQRSRPSQSVPSEFAVRRYRPRVEAGFARIERWEDTATDDVHWRTVSKDNVTSLFGQTPASRIADPGDPARVFSWLLDLSFDDRGNAISYEYKAEDRPTCRAARTRSVGP